MSKENINLPKTSFSMKANLPNKEPEILKIWENIDLYKKLRKSNKGKEKFDKDHHLSLKISLTVSSIFILFYFIYPNILNEIINKINII